MPAKVINAEEWSAHNKNNHDDDNDNGKDSNFGKKMPAKGSEQNDDYDDDDDDIDGDDDSNYGKKIPAKHNNKKPQ